MTAATSSCDRLAALSVLRRAAEPPGFFWIYVPMQFTDRSLFFAAQERPDGSRILEEAARRGIVPAMYVTGPHDARPWRARGVRAFACSIDYKVLAGAYSSIIRGLREG